MLSAHSGSNLLPEPGVILDAGSLIANYGGEGSGSDHWPTVWRSNGNYTASKCHCWWDTKRYDNSVKFEQNTMNLKSGVLGTKK